jgi:3-hydroxyisobutyrate dehydrogenase-like beta-hydroxyacid dehydrogenase
MLKRKILSFGKNGIIAAGRKQLIIAYLSTFSPEHSKYCADRLRQKQIDFIAMPVMGGPMAAKKAN